jgi:glycosyltransferase involved in cell wall biosynthesis
VTASLIVVGATSGGHQHRYVERFATVGSEMGFTRRVLVAPFAPSDLAMVTDSVRPTAGPAPGQRADRAVRAALLDAALDLYDHSAGDVIAVPTADPCSTELLRRPRALRRFAAARTVGVFHRAAWRYGRRRGRGATILASHLSVPWTARLHVAHEGVLLDRPGRAFTGFSPLPDELPAAFVAVAPRTSGGGRDRSTITVVGGLGPRKAIAPLMGAFRSSAALRRDATLVLAGRADPGTTRAIEAAAADLGRALEWRPGRMEDDVLAETVAASSCYAALVAGHPGMSSFGMNALALGVPAVATAGSWMALLIESLGLGALVGPDERGLDDPPRLARFLAETVGRVPVVPADVVASIRHRFSTESHRAAIGRALDRAATSRPAQASSR